MFIEEVTAVAVGKAAIEQTEHDVQLVQNIVRSIQNKTPGIATATAAAVSTEKSREIVR